MFSAKQIVAVLAVAAALPLAAAKVADPGSLDEVIKKVQEQQRKTTTLQADFRQLLLLAEVGLQRGGLALLFLDLLDHLVEGAGICHFGGREGECGRDGQHRHDLLCAEHAASNAGAKSENFLYCSNKRGDHEKSVGG